MELKTKYQYTYFIKPFLIQESKYEQYIYSLLENKNCTLKIFEKEKDLDLYSYFLQNTKNYFFPTFNFSKEKIKELNKIDNKLKSTILSQLHCNVFEYNIKDRIQGKSDDNDGIFFDIGKIEIICFDTGICFLLLKTYIENSNNFSDILDFNYKFKDINADYLKLKSINNIKIQTNAFESMMDISKFIKEITGVNFADSKLKDVDMYNQRFFVYTYTCIDQDNWDDLKDFNNIENDFLKYSNVMANNNTLDLENIELDKNIQEVAQFKYARFGFTKQSASLMCSSMDINNYTKLLFEYDTNYLYTLLISLYERIYLKKISIELKNKRNINLIRVKFTKFTKEIWEVELSNSITGSLFYEKWKNVFELEKIYNQIKDEYDVLYKELQIENTNKTNKIIVFALGISIFLNIINLIALFTLKKL
jgi:hypothetical protein